MGKKSLTKSTTKKKPIKKSGKKKTAGAPATKKTSTTSKKPATKTLLKKQFETWSPESLYQPEPDSAYESNFAAPPVIEAKGKEAEKIRSLLTREFAMSSSSPKTSAPKKAANQKAGKKTTKAETKTTAKTAATKKKEPAAKNQKAEKKPVSVKDLLGRKFDTWAPEKPYSPKTDAEYEKNFAAPAAFESADKSLISRQFDMNEIKASAKAPEEAPVETQTENIPRKEPVPVEELLKKKFDSWKPAKPYSPEPDAEYEKNFAAPAAFESIDKSLISRKYDMDEIKTVAKAPAEPVSTEPPEKPAEVSKDKVEPTSEGKITEEEEAVKEASAEPVPEAAEKEEPVKAEEPAPAEPVAAEKPEKPAEVAKDKIEPTPEGKTPDQTEQVSAGVAAEKPAEEKPAEKVAEKPKKAEKPAASEKPKKASKKEATPPPPEPPKKTPSGGGGGGGSSMPPQPPAPPKEPMNTGLLMLIVGLVVIFALIIGGSILNMQDYYVKKTDEAIEIWRGDFSPRGSHKIATLRGAEAPDEVEELQDKEKILTLAFNYYMKKADALTESNGDLIDFKAIRKYLSTAKEYAATDEQRKLVDRRITGINFMMLLYKAEVAADRKTEEGFETALDFVKEARQLTLAPDQVSLLNNKVREIRAQKEMFEASEKFVAPPEERTEVLPDVDESEAESAPQDSESTDDEADAKAETGH